MSNTYDIISLTVDAIFIGVGATIIMDLWGIFLKRSFGIVGLNYGLVGRWVGHFARGQFSHAKITSAMTIKHENAIGWGVHYATGIVFTLGFLLVVSKEWLDNPSALAALGFGLLTIVFPFFVMQPCLGLGFAASKTPAPTNARLKSAVTHLIFGLGLYLSALIISLTSLI